MVLSLERWIGKVAIVSGASSGCGAAIAERLVLEGLKVVGLARRKNIVDNLAKKLEGKMGKLYAIKTDVTKEEDVIAAFNWTKEHLGPIHVLVNSAGIAQDTTLSDGDANKWRKVIDTNVFGLSLTTREAVKDMTKNEVAGQIIHIGSVLGHYVAHLPKLNMYAASKFAIKALTETLRQELLHSGTKIRICSISPGPVDTPFVQPENADKDFIEKFKAMPKLQTDDIADAVVYILSTPAYVQVQDIMIRPLGEPV